MLKDAWKVEDRVRIVPSMTSSITGQWFTVQRRYMGRWQFVARFRGPRDATRFRIEEIAMLKELI